MTRGRSAGASPAGGEVGRDTRQVGSRKPDRGEAGRDAQAIDRRKIGFRFCGTLIWPATLIAIVHLFGQNVQREGNA